MVLTPFTLRTIKELEDLNGGNSFVYMIRNPSINNLCLFIRKGMNLKNQEEAIVELENYINEGHTIEDLVNLIGESLRSCGFLLPKVTPQEAQSQPIDQTAP